MWRRCSNGRGGYGQQFRRELLKNASPPVPHAAIIVPKATGARIKADLLWRFKFALEEAVSQCIPIYTKI